MGEVSARAEQDGRASDGSENVIVGKKDQSRLDRFLGKADARAEQTAREDRDAQMHGAAA